jgi:type II secretory pathway component GspD/PulD (secretin)
MPEAHFYGNQPQRRGIMARSTAMFALALTAMLAMGAGEKGHGTGDKGQGAAGGHAVRAAAAPMAADAANESDVEKALEKQVSVKLKDTPLKETAAYLADLSGVNVLLDSKALADAGIAEDIPVSFEMANVSLGAALRAMLAEHELGYTIPDDNVLSITTAQRAKEDVVMRVYDVAGFTSHSAAANEFADVGSPNDATAIVEVITSCVQPTSWSNSGGSSTIGPLNDRLVISTNLEAHRQIGALLASLRKTIADERAGRAATQFVDDGPAALKIRDKLDSRQDFDFHETPLVELRDYLRAQGIPLSIDQKQLSDAGTVLDVSLSFKAKHVPLKFALRTILKSHGLSYVLRDEALSITSEPAANSTTRIALYPVGDLLESTPCPAVGDVDCDSLVATITSTLAPTAWRDSGGEGSISLLRSEGVAVISQTEEIHEQIADMLTKMRTVKHSATEMATARPHAEAKEAMVVRVHHVASKEDAALDQYIAVIRNLVWTEGGSYIGKVPGAIIVRHTPAVQQRIKNLLTEIDGSSAGGGGFGGGGLGGGGAFQVAPEIAATESPKSAALAPGDKTEATPAAEQTPVERALDKPIEFEFVKTPLKDVAAALSKKSGINIILDEKAITDVGGGLDMPITRSFIGVPFELALLSTLKEHELNFLEIDDNVLQITSDIKVKEFVVTRTYEVRDLAEPMQRSRGDQTPLDGLVDLLTSIIAPTTWTQSGGTGSIAVFGNQLVISQTREIQGQIIDLLAALRLARDKPETYREGGSARPVSEAKLQKWLSEIPKPRGKGEESGDNRRAAWPRVASETDIRTLLETRQDFDYHEAPLKDICDALKIHHGFEIQLDAKAISDAGGSIDMPITFSAKNIRLKTALKLMLQAHELNFIIENQVVLITTDAKAKEHVVTRLYSVRDLLSDPSTDSSAEGASYDNLIDTITSTVNPTSWDSAGGTGSLKPFSLVRVLVCSQTQEAHEEIAKLLAMLRAQRTAKAAPEGAQPKTKGENVTRFYRLALIETDAAAEYLAVVKKLIEPSKYAYLGKVQGGIVAHCLPATHERIKELLMKLEALPDPADGAN